MLESASKSGIEAIELGMSHRGRLNILRNVFHIPPETMLSNFQPYLPDDGEHPNHSDDVRYHLGTHKRLFYSEETELLPELEVEDMESYKKGIEVTLAANPSHLEAVNSVVLGKVRARQFLHQKIPGFPPDKPGQAPDLRNKTISREKSIDLRFGDSTSKKRDSELRLMKR